MDQININDLPTRWHAETVAELYSLAHAMCPFCARACPRTANETQ